MGLFQKASKSQSRLRMTLVGPSGSGKTYSAMLIAESLDTALGGTGRIAVIDTEHGSASKYSDRFSFDALELANFDPRQYIEAIQAAEAEGYNVLIIDSLTHAWSGKGGALELVDKAAKKSKSNNTYTAWRDVTPLHNALVDAMIGSNCHIIATMRSKVDYVLEADPTNGKLSPKKVGMAPIQREGMDYEFDVVADIDLDHTLIITKTRCAALDGEIVNKPGRQLALKLAAWLGGGAPIVAKPVPVAPAPAIQPATQGDGGGDVDLYAMPAHLTAAITQPLIDELHRLIGITQMTDYQVRSALARRGVSEITHLTVHDAEQMISNLNTIASKIEWANSVGTEPVKVGEDAVDAAAGTETETHAETNGAVTAETIDNPATDNLTIGDTDRPIRPEPEKKPRKKAGQTA